MAEQLLQPGLVGLDLVGLLLWGERTQAGVSQGMAPDLHMTGGHQRLDLLRGHQGHRGIGVGRVLHIPAIVILTGHHIDHRLVAILFQQRQHAGEVVPIAVVHGDHQVLLAVLQPVDEPVLRQVGKCQRLVAQPLHQLEVLLEHGDREPGAMHPLFTLVLDEAVIHDDRHLPAQGLDHGILIDGFQPGHDALQIILLQDPLTHWVWHHLGGQRRRDLRLQTGKIDGQIPGADVAEVAGKRLVQILLRHQTDGPGFADGKRRTTAQQRLHRHPTGTDHQIAARHQGGHIVHITDEVDLVLKTGKTRRHLGTADDAHPAGFQIQYLVQQPVAELPLGTAQPTNDGDHRFVVVRYRHGLELVGLDAVAQHLHHGRVHPQVVDDLAGDILAHCHRPIAQRMECLAGGVYRLAPVHRGDHGGAGQLAGDVAAPARGARMGVYKLDPVLADQIDEIEDVPEAAQDAALVEAQPKDRPQSRLGQGVRDVENLVATAGQLVADRGGIDLRARHFELGESHQYVHASASDRRVARATRQRGIKPGSTRPCNRPRLRPQS